MRAPHLDAVDLIAKMAAGDLAWGLMWLWTKRCTVLIVLWTMRRMVSMLGGSEGTEALLGRLAKSQTNSEFLTNLHKDV